jgi:hypothetical protein
VAKPNYAFEKRQRELAKKNKKAEKAKEKADRKAHPTPEGEGEAMEAPEPGETGALPGPDGTAGQQAAAGAPPVAGGAAG